MTQPQTIESTESTDAILERIEETGSAAAELVGTVLQVGRLWASHGLSVADRTLQAAAKSLEVTAQTLADLSRRFGDEEPAND